MARVVFFLALIHVALAQQYTISTVAGIGLLPFGGAGAPAVAAFLIEPNYVATDSAGNTFVSDQYYQQVFRIDSSGIISVYAGNGQQGYSGDGGPASAAQLAYPSGLVVDSRGDLYIADNGNAAVRKVTPDGAISTFASVAADALALDAADNLYVSEASANLVVMIGPSGAMTTIAGTGAPGYSGDGGPATAATLYSPVGLKLDSAGNLYVADSLNNRIRRIDSHGVISTIAGNGKTGLTGDNGPATAASLSGPTDVAIDAQGNLYIADFSSSRIRMVNPAGLIQEFAGGGASLQDGPAAQASLVFPDSLAIDRAGNLIVALTKNKQVRHISPQGAITTIAGVVPTTSAGDNIPATSAPLFDPFGIVTDGGGNVYVSDYDDNRIREISPSGIITTFAGDGLFGTSANNGAPIEVGSPHGLALDASGDLYYTSGSGNIVRRITPNGIVNTVAGGGPPNTLGDGGTALGAQLRLPIGLVVDGAGTLYIAEYTACRIRRVNTLGIITTIAGTGVPGYSGDNGPGAAAQLYQPYQVALDGVGNLYVADSGNNRVRKIGADGTITTVAGNGVNGADGDGGLATDAQLSSPTGIAVDAAGNLYIADYGNAEIRMVSAATGVITTIAGTGTAGFSGDGGPATAAGLDGPLSLALDNSGNIYFTDEGNYRVRMLTPGIQ